MIRPPWEFKDDRCPDCHEPYNWLMGYEVDDEDLMKRKKSGFMLEEQNVIDDVGADVLSDTKPGSVHNDPPDAGRDVQPADPMPDPSPAAGGTMGGGAPELPIEGDGVLAFWQGEGGW